MKALVIANPFPASGGGSIRALKSLKAYPSKGIETYIVFPLSSILVWDNDVIKVLLNYNIRPSYMASLRIPLNPARPLPGQASIILSSLIFMHKRVMKLKPLSKKMINNIDAIISFHENIDALCLLDILSNRFKYAKKIAVLQSAPIHAFKSRKKIIEKTLKMWYSLAGYKAYYSFVVSKLNKFVEGKLVKILNKTNINIGISEAICVECSGKIPNMYCMNPGVTLDEEDIKLLEYVKNKVGKNRSKYIIFGGRPSPLKGVVDALFVFRRIFREHSSIKLIINGVMGRTRLVLRKICEKIGIRDRVKLTGWVSREERFKIIRGAKLMLYPSHVDAYPFSVIESLYLETPIVAYDIPALRLYHSCNPGVRIVKEGDIEAMAIEALNILESNRLEITKPKIRSWDEILNEEVNLLKKILRS